MNMSIRQKKKKINQPEHEKSCQPFFLRRICECKLSKFEKIWTLMCYISVVVNKNWWNDWHFKGYKLIDWLPHENYKRHIHHGFISQGLIFYLHTVKKQKKVIKSQNKDKTLNNANLTKKRFGDAYFALRVCVGPFLYYNYFRLSVMSWKSKVAST